jgi:hypothetical protein
MATTILVLQICFGLSTKNGATEKEDEMSGLTSENNRQHWDACIKRARRIMFEENRKAQS